MHYVYLIEFTDRVKQGNMPYYYIGSKSNSTFDGTHIRDRKQRIYLGSASDKGYAEAVASEPVRVHILLSTEDYSDCISFERSMHIKHDVVADPRYWNKAIAAESSYANPNYATMRHTITGKCVRIPKDHPRVLSGEYVGTTGGKKVYNNGTIQKTFYPGEDTTGFVPGQLESSIRKGPDNANYGKTPPKEKTERGIASRKKTYEEDPERFDKIRKEASERASRMFKGVPKSKESNLKRSRPGYIMLKNIETGECVRILKIEAESYDRNIWKNPASLAKPSGTGSRWSTNGVENIKLKAGEELPTGFIYGRTMK